jgi:competence protein ComEA
MWKWFTDYFDLRRGERRGAAVLLSFILVLIIAQFLVKYIVPKRHYDFSEIQALADDFQRNKGNEQAASDSEENHDFFEAEKPAEYFLFKFDPNTLDEAGFIRLGLSKRIASNIIKYRSKGGRFRKPDDFKKIYGLPSGKFEELRPYITLTSTASPVSENTIVNINTADSTALVSLYGIGPAFASRIIKYRSLLGGFYRKEQLLEVYGLDSTRYAGFEKSITATGGLRRININTAGKAELKHPYLKHNLVNAIIQYRKEYGPFKSISDLKKVPGVAIEMYQKLEPYLSVE